MDQAQARALLAAERARLQRLLQVETGESQAQVARLILAAARVGARD
jgi:hypothetical protein